MAGSDAPPAALADSEGRCPIPNDSPLFIVDSFAAAAFRGNPAAVVTLRAPASAPAMQRLAAEMNLSETVFTWPTHAPDPDPDPDGDGNGDGDGDGNGDGGCGCGCGCFDIRWFTPTREVMLCGHATLAAAHVLATEPSCLSTATPTAPPTAAPPTAAGAAAAGVAVAGAAVAGAAVARLRFFNPLSGPLVVTLPAAAAAPPSAAAYALDLPARPPDRSVLAALRRGALLVPLCAALGLGGHGGHGAEAAGSEGAGDGGVDGAAAAAEAAVEDVLLHEHSRKYLVVLRRPADVLTAAPVAAALLAHFTPAVAPLSVTVSAAVGGAAGPWGPAAAPDVVSRHFAPWVGIPEDPATGAAHVVLGPYWARRLSLPSLRCFQADPRRGGWIAVDVPAEPFDRVTLRGEAVTIMRGRLCVTVEG